MRLHGILRLQRSEGCIPSGKQPVSQTQRNRAGKLCEDDQALVRRKDTSSDDLRSNFESGLNVGIEMSTRANFSVVEVDKIGRL